LVITVCTAHQHNVEPLDDGIGVGDGGKGSCPRPQIREKKYFSGKHRVTFGQLILEEGRTGTLYFLTVFCFSFHVYVEYSFEFRNPFFIFLRYRA